VPGLRAGDSVSYALRFELPGLPRCNASDNRNRWVRAKERDEWHQRIAAAIGRDLPASPLHRAGVTYIRRSSIEPDYDNLVSSFKGIQDSLTRLGVLVDDKPSVVGVANYRHEKAPPKRGSVVVEVLEVEPS